MYFGDHPDRGRWGAHLEGQLHRHDVITRWQQEESGGSLVVEWQELLSRHHRTLSTAAKKIDAADIQLQNA